ncbi:GspH/FimT family pseudopilin [Frateuria hangzhouensis]|uniref:GspH/FimT family pseudopilin n=1 Tax=Frateuria hangzhouensis TaxID=2995589 RepID=UPI002260E48F|nr:GspH/FimT family pseudopilin [Frateuria sp. STR12]MCX7513702.1 GspH/FimT family pseudopilin [Frateuria sp. STR12]
MAGTLGSRRDSARGITLVEQVMVVAILAILAGIASPSLAGLVRRGRVQSAQMDFLEGLGFARGEAVLLRARVLFCPTRDRVHCSDESRWDSGWLVGVDRDRDNQPDDAPLRVGDGHTRLLIQSSVSRQHVAFLPDGSASGSNLTLVFCTPGGRQEPLGVVVSNSGRVRGSRPRGEKAEACS